MYILLGNRLLLGFKKIYRSSPNVWTNYSMGKDAHILIWSQTGLGYSLGNFWTNLSCMLLESSESVWRHFSRKKYAGHLKGINIVFIASVPKYTARNSQTNYFYANCYWNFLHKPRTSDKMEIHKICPWSKTHLPHCMTQFCVNSMTRQSVL
jgi:hypothetical protein